MRRWRSIPILGLLAVPSSAQDKEGFKINPGVDQVKVERAIARGVSVYQSDIEQGLADYPDAVFDFVILSQTLQEMRYPLRVLRAMPRAGRHAIVAFPNFGHWSVRLSHLFTGRSPRIREVWRNGLLEARGWKIHRVWSDSWWLNRDAEIRRLRMALGAAQQGETAYGLRPD